MWKVLVYLDPRFHCCGVYKPYLTFGALSF